MAQAWLSSTKPLVVNAFQDGQVNKAIWFKSEPIGREFYSRVAQIQLCTNSHDQGSVNDKTQGSWTWFELVILPNATATEPKNSKNGKPLVWKSHSNQLGQRTSTMHFGFVFDRRSELLANLEIGDVLAVRVCSQWKAWVNHADSGYITARVLKEDLFTPHHWTLASNARPTLDGRVEDGSYSFVSTTTCNVRSDGDQLQSKIWFTTPALDKESIEKLESVQLFTRARRQTAVLPGESRSWFELVILEKPTDIKPKNADLVWLSHRNLDKDYGMDLTPGTLFDENDRRWYHFGFEDIALIKGSLEAGNAIGVHVCAQGRGWENYAESGQLVVRISNEAKKPRSFMHVLGL